MGDNTRSSQCQQENQVFDEDAGFTTIRNEILYSGLTHYQIRVYIHLKSRAWGPCGKAWDSKNQMAAICGMDERILKRTLIELQGYGLVIEIPLPPTASLKDERARKNQRAYRLPAPRDWRLPPNPILNFDGTYRKKAEPSINAPIPQISGCKNVPTSGCKNVPTSTSLLEEEDEQKKNSPLKGCEGVKTPRAATPEKTPGSRVWEAYSEGMRRRWRIDPPRNAKTGAQCKQLVELVGIDNAMALAKAYPQRLDKWYVEKGHPIGLLLTDYPKILRDLALGFKVTREMATTLERTFDGSQAMTLAEQGIMPSPLDALPDSTVVALPGHDEPLF